MDEILIILFFIIFIIIVIVFYYYYHQYNIDINNTVIINNKNRCHKKYEIIKEEKEEDEIIKEETIEDKIIKEEHPGYLNDLIKKPDIYDDNNEYIKQLTQKINYTDDYKSDNQIGFNLKDKKEINSLPYANINVHLL